MVMTILEAHVDRENWHTLQEAFREGVQKPDRGIVRTHLTQSQKDEHLWRIVTIWNSQEALDLMRRSQETPRGVLMFRSARAEPTLSAFNIVVEWARQ